MRKLCLILAGILMLTACKANPNENNTNNEPEVENPGRSMNLETSFNSLMDGLLVDGGENSCISPLSIKLALAMAYNGADGETKELLNTLFEKSPEELNEWAKAFLAAAANYDGKNADEYSAPNPELRVANSFWIRKGDEKEISKDFTEALTGNFNAESGEFNKNPDPINKWIAKATNDKIQNMLDDISPEAITYLVNALYFKAQWVQDFSESATAPATFNNADGSTVDIDMLNGWADGYINTDKFEGITKNLFGGFTFTALMPKTDEDVTLDEILDASNDVDYDYSVINLRIPKFDLETSVEIGKGNHKEFDALFADNGMNKAIAQDAENLTNLYISKVVHKTTFTLAEAGIEASAATVIMMETAAADIEPKEVSIVFDKPFYYTLTDSNGEVLFVGRIRQL
ncbi:MAG: hypothetical protein LBQ95_02250 [Lachnospiraceae bacterium]|jgi:serpin B|nr:hypothetical protein [Lachnospiraceae bacterium]